MNTPNQNIRQLGRYSGNEMTSSPKNNDHENAGLQDIIEANKVARYDLIMEASIMSPEKNINHFQTDSRDPCKEDAIGMTLPPERIREGGIGVSVAAALNAMWAANDAQRDRQKNGDVKINANEVVCIGVENLTKLKSVVAAMQTVIAETQVALDAEDHQYVKKALRLQVDFDATFGNDVDRWIEVMGPHAPSANSFYSMRAAMCWQMKRVIAENLRQLSELDMSSEMDVLNDLLKQLDRHKKTLEIVENLKRADVLHANEGTSRKPESLRETLEQLPHGWQAKIVARAQASEIYADAVAILALSGCRPDELVQGISVRLDAEPAVIRIRGAKLGEHAGQSWREFEVPTTRLPAHMLLCLRQDRDVAYVKVESTDALRQALYRYSRELWPAGILVSPYHFRHSMAETLRENGWAAHEIAGVLGERSAETVSLYGRKIRPHRSGKREIPEVLIVKGSVKTAMPITPLPLFNASNFGVNAQKIQL